MGYLISVVIGYFIGCLSPSYVIAKLKKVEIRKVGSGNLGGTNTYFHVGKGWGIFVALFDIFKAIFSVIICQYLFPDLINVGLIAGVATIIGHMFPVFLKFKGGKGLACMGGLVLATEWRFFIILLIIGCLLSILFNYGVMVAISAAVFYPIMYSIKMQSLIVFFILLIPSAAMIYKHMGNVRNIQAGEETSVREAFSSRN